MTSLSQSTEPYDVIAVDDGSVPPLDTGGFSVHLIRLDHNQGIVAALNTGLAFALRQGYAYIARIDAGDFADPRRLATQAAYLDRHSECMMTGCDVDVYAGDGEYQFTISPPRQRKALVSALKERSWLLHSTIMFRASVFGEVGLYSNEFEAAEDYEMCLRIAARYPVSVVPERLVSVVFSPTGISLTRRKTQLVSRIRLQLRYFQWGCPRSYSGLFKSLVSLSLPPSFGRWLKRNLIYRRSEPSTIDSPTT